MGEETESIAPLMGAPPAMSGKPIVLDPGKLIFGGITVRGFWGAKWIERASSADKLRVLGEVLRLVKDGTIKLGVEAEYDLADVREAGTRSEQSGRAGMGWLYATPYSRRIR